MTSWGVFSGTASFVGFCPILVPKCAANGPIRLQQCAAGLVAGSDALEHGTKHLDLFLLGKTDATTPDVWKRFRYVFSLWKDRMVPGLTFVWGHG